MTDYLQQARLKMEQGSFFKTMTQEECLQSMAADSEINTMLLCSIAESLARIADHGEGEGVSV